MSSPRAAGILLHPTSLPGRFGIGDLGPGAHRWIEFLAAAGQKRWQVLPLTPTGYGDSPYQSFSSFAGNPLLVSPEALYEDGLLGAEDLERLPAFRPDRVDYGAVIPFKLDLLGRAYRRFRAGSAPTLVAPFEAFRARNAGWLEEFALFMALKREAGGGAWTGWAVGVAGRSPAALEAARLRLESQCFEQCFHQFVFFRQWEALRQRARAAGVAMVGDLPIFVAHDSADVWADPQLFDLDAHGAPARVAGVPPDYFSDTGQRWGNPLYRWDRHRESGFAWWIARLGAALALVDVVRIDHFRGFESCWEIPADSKTAVTGRWAPGPGAEFFEHVARVLGGLPLIAEDLGVVTPQVIALRDSLGLPGMKVLQFAFGDGPDHPFLPHRHVRNCVVYTGTHDNDTTRGWFGSAAEAERALARRVLASDGREIAWDMVTAAFASVADTAIVPLQDVLGLGSEARMNFPGRAAGNWAWRFTAEQLGAAVVDRLGALTALHGR